MKEELKVAIIQTTLDNRVAWSKYSVNAPEMDYTEAARVWKEIILTLDSLNNMEDSQKPDIVILPELTVAGRYEKDIRSLADETGCIIIAGLDFKLIEDEVENNAIVAIPYRWPHGYGRARRKSFLVGKHFPAREEKNFIDSCNKQFKSCDNIYLFDTNDYGNIGLAICADFYDIERFALYKGRIQHLFILAYNKDIKSFNYLCEAISRLVYCNVIICNTGHYGGSVCYSLKEKEYQRYIYRHEGAELFTSQVVKLPVRSFVEEQMKNPEKTTKGYKNQPPGYELKNKEEYNKK